MNDSKSYNDHLGHSIKRLYYSMGQYFNTILRPYGVAQNQWYILYAISQSTSMTQRELQTALQVESATLTAAIDTLVRKGWVERRQSKTDRRVNELCFTSAGKELWSKLPDPIVAVRAQMLQGIDTMDVEITKKIIDQAIKNLEQ